MDKRKNSICTFDSKSALQDNLFCEVPVSVIYSVFQDGTVSKECDYSKVSTAFLADFLAQKFGIDFDRRSMKAD